MTLWGVANPCACFAMFNKLPTRAQVHYAYESKSCLKNKHHRADRLEPMVCNYVSGVMKNPEQLRSDLDRMI